MKEFKISLLILIFPFFLIAQASPDNLSDIAPDRLREDLQILKENLEVVHPGLYTYVSKAELDNAFATIDAGLTTPMNSIEFFREITPLLQMIGNGHTNFFPARDFFREWGNYLLFPFDVYWNEDRLFVLKNFSDDESILPGMLIESINGEAAGKVIRELSDYMTRDGYNSTLPEAKASGGFYRWYASFKGTPETFRLVISDADGKVRDLEVTALKEELISQNRQKRYPSNNQYGAGDNAVLQLKIDDNIATLTVQTFSKKYAKKRGQKFKRFFNNAFEEMAEAKVDHLILDLRNNGGGDPRPTLELLKHLSEEPVTLYKKVSATTRKVPNKKLYQDKVSTLHLFTRLAFKKDGDAYKVKGMAAKMKGLAGLKPEKPAKDVFNGKLYILTNPYSFSATTETTAILKQMDRGPFIGEEAGGNPNQNASGIMLSLDLPNSGNRVSLPLVLFEVNVDFENTGHGVLPDYVVKHPVGDLLINKDTVMDFTLDLIQKESTPIQATAK